MAELGPVVVLRSHYDCHQIRPLAEVSDSELCEALGKAILDELIRHLCIERGTGGIIAGEKQAMAIKVSTRAAPNTSIATT